MSTRKTFALAGLWTFLVVVAVHFLQFPGSVPDFSLAPIRRSATTLG